MIPMNVINLFAGANEEHLEKPWKSGGAIYATDLRMAITIEDGTDRELQEPEPNKRRQSCERLFKTPSLSAASSHHKVEDIELLAGAGCCECGGKGDVESYTCPQCRGSGSAGECPHCGHDMECGACNGTGTKKRQGTCRQCDGTGKYFKPVRLGEASFQGRFISRLKKLPNCRIEVTTSGGPARFFFDGGRGFLMPFVE